MPFTKRVRFIYRYSVAYISRHARFLIISFIGGFFFFFFVFKVTPLLGPIVNPDIKRVGIIGQYSPDTLPIPIQKLISVGLTEVQENGEPKAGLAESWEIKDGGKQYIFYLKKNLLWHDGNDFTASDINYNIQDVIFKVVNKHTVAVTLKEPFAPFPVILSRPLLRPGLIGLGPYKVTAIKLKSNLIESMSLTANAKELPNLELKFYITEAQARMAFKLGSIDILEDVSDPGEFKKWQSVNITQRIDHTRYIALFYNLNDKILADKGIRQALSFAVPTLDSDERATGPISPLSWAYSNKVRQYKYDIQAAQRMLGNTKKDEKGSDQRPSITISTFTPYLQIAKRIAESWQSLGFTVNVKLNNAVPDNYQVLLAAQDIPPDPDQYNLWHSMQKDSNITNLTSPKIDKLLEDGRSSINKDERLKIYADFQKYLVDEAPATFLYFPSVYTIARKR